MCAKNCINTLLKLFGENCRSFFPHMVYITINVCCFSSRMTIAFCIGLDRLQDRSLCDPRGSEKLFTTVLHGSRGPCPQVTPDRSCQSLHRLTRRRCCCHRHAPLHRWANGSTRLTAHSKPFAHDLHTGTWLKLKVKALYGKPTTSIYCQITSPVCPIWIVCASWKDKVRTTQLTEASENQ